ncbi:MAG: polysaccharide deacetylase [Lachnospiraceae bacterium]|nr:polysaccharide deacetylase [Lachnospiraceae bacterium]
MSEVYELTDEIRKREQKLKTIFISVVVIIAISIPSVLCFILMGKLSLTRQELTTLEEQLNQKNALILDTIYDDITPPTEVIETSIFQTARLEESGRARISQTDELNEQTDEKKIYLTFDDGPSINTDRILDILDEYGIKATFFVIGKTDERSLNSYRRIVNEGHTLGMHSYSHRYQEIYRSLDAFTEDLNKLQELLYLETGVWSRYYRFPGGSSNTVSRTDMQELIGYLNEQDIKYFDWNISSGDAASEPSSASRIINNCMSGLSGKSEGMILFHDTAEKYSTVLALPEIIDGIMAKGNYVFLPIDDETLSVRHITN